MSGTVLAVPSRVTASCGPRPLTPGPGPWDRGGPRKARWGCGAGGGLPRRLRPTRAGATAPRSPGEAPGGGVLGTPLRWGLGCHRLVRSVWAPKGLFLPHPAPQTLSSGVPEQSLSGSGA